MSLRSFFGYNRDDLLVQCFITRGNILLVSLQKKVPTFYTHVVSLCTVCCTIDELYVLL